MNLECDPGTSLARVMRIRHAFRLGCDVVSYAVVNRVWWVLPLMVVLALVALAVTATHAIVPYTVYTLF